MPGLAILLVEDHRDTSTVLRRLLEQRGYLVSCAGSAAEARALCQQSNFDLLICDIVLPDGNGWDLRRQLRDLSGAPAIALTARGYEVDRQRSREAGFALHLVKPARVEEMIQAIESVCAPAPNTSDALASCEALLETAMQVMGADFASMQRFNGAQGWLRLIAWKNFHQESAAHWNRVTVGTNCCCGMALRQASRIVITDVEASAATIDAANLKEFRRSGIRAVQSTPLYSPAGAVLGMLSTHWRGPHDPSPEELERLQPVLGQAAEMLERLPVT